MTRLPDHHPYEDDDVRARFRTLGVTQQFVAATMPVIASLKPKTKRAFRVDQRRFQMRPIAIATAVMLAVLPLAAHAQSTTTTTTTTRTEISQSDLDKMWQKIKGSWTQTKGAVKEQWGKLTDNDFLEIQGRREKLVGKIQTRYGISHEQAEAEVANWEQKYHSM